MNKNAFKAWSSTTVSAIYEKARPKYNIDSVEFLLEKVGALKTHSESQPFTIVELGAGTGKFTRAVLIVLEKRAVKNVKIISTEPIKEMCEKFKEMVPNNEILQRRADNLGHSACISPILYHRYKQDQELGRLLETDPHLFCFLCIQLDFVLFSPDLQLIHSILQVAVGA